MGFKIIKNGILFILFYILNVFISLFIAYSLFSYDFKNSLDNIFLRISPKKWLFYKCISCFIFTILFRFILFLFITMFLFIFSKYINISLILLFLKNVSYILFIQLSFVLLIYSFQSRKYTLFSLISVFILFCSKILIFSINFWWIYILFDFLLIILLMFVYKNNFTNLFERYGD